MSTIRILFLLMAGGLQGAATISMPTVDLAPNTVSSPALMAVWASTDALIPVSTTVSIILPSDYALPAGLTGTSCNCIFLRHTSTTAGAWAKDEVTVTASTMNGQMINISMPADVHPGKFYIRFDQTAGLINPATTGMATLSVVDPAGNVTLSRGFYVRASTTSSAALGSISGTVKDSAGKALPGALVMASNYGTYLPASISARSNWIPPMNTSQNAYSTSTGSDGSYSMSVPAGDYTVRVEVWKHKNQVLNSSSGDSSATVASGATTLVNFNSLNPLP